MRVIFRLLATTLGLITPLTAALAADLLPESPVPTVAPLNWSGPYVGGVAGYSWGDSVQFFTASGGGAIRRFDIDGFNGGGTLGFNWQFDPRWVAGLEVDFSGSDIEGRGASSLTYSCGRICSTDVTAFRTLRGRVGYAFGSVLIYGTGGWAYGRISPNLNGGSDASYRSGWTAGGGAEYAFAPHWSAKVEYLYLDFDSYVWTNASNSFFSCTGLNCSTDARFDVVRVGLNYRFGWH
jgi:outer membrane immunogenic protein